MINRGPMRTTITYNTQQYEVRHSLIV